MSFGGSEPVSGCFLEFLTQKGNGFSSLWCAWDDQAQIPRAIWLNTKAGGNRSFPRPSLRKEVRCELAISWLCLYLLSWAFQAQQQQSFPQLCSAQWLTLNRPSKRKQAAGGLPGWCIAMLLATHRAIIVSYRPCRDVLSICILCSHRLLNSHANFSGPNGDGFHLPASLVCWAAEAILMKSFAFLGQRWSTE